MRKLFERRRPRAEKGTPTTTRYKVIVASLIAITSLLGAVSAWRAEHASMKGEEAERKGFADSVANEQAKSDIRQRLQDQVFDYQRAQSYAAQATALREQAAKASKDDRVRILAQAKTQQRLAKLVSGYIDPDAKRPDGTLDPKHYFVVNYTQAQQGQDLNAQPEFKASDHLATKSERLVGLTALLIAAAFFFTLGQVSRRRLSRHLYVGGGVVVLLTAGVLLLTVELTT